MLSFGDQSWTDVAISFGPVSFAERRSLVSFVLGVRVPFTPGNFDLVVEGASEASYCVSPAQSINQRCTPEPQ